MILLNIIFTVFAIYILIQAIIEKRPLYRQMKRSIGFRSAKLIYIDKQEEVKQNGVTYGKLLRSEKYGLSGKPDYIYQLGNELIPLELKSSKVEDNSPLYKDVMQLAAYFLIMEEVYGKKILRGRIVYQNTMFEVYNRRQLKRELLELLKNMHMMENGSFHPDVKPSYAMCRHCPCRGTVCKLYKEESF